MEPVEPAKKVKKHRRPRRDRPSAAGPALAAAPGPAPAAAAAVPSIAPAAAVAAAAPRPSFVGAREHPKTKSMLFHPTTADGVRLPSSPEFHEPGQALGYVRAARPPGYTEDPPHPHFAHIMRQVMDHLPLADRKNFRRASRASLRAVQEHALRRPVASPGDLVLGNPFHFPEQFKRDPKPGKKSKPRKPIGVHAALDEAVDTYKRVAANAPKDATAPRPTAYIEPRKAIPGLFDDKARKAELVKGGQLLNSPTWTTEINDTWMQAHIHQRNPVRYLGAPTDEDLWERDAARPTVLGREVVQLTRAGYTPTPATPDDATDDFAGRGVLFHPPALDPHRPGTPPRLSDALLDARAHLDAFHKAMKPPEEKKKKEEDPK